MTASPPAPVSPLQAVLADAGGGILETEVVRVPQSRDGPQRGFDARYRRRSMWAVGRNLGKPDITYASGVADLADFLTPEILTPR